MSMNENPYAAPATSGSDAKEFWEFQTTFLPSWYVISLSAFINVPLVVFSCPGPTPLSVGAITLVVTLLFSAVANFLIIQHFTVRVSANRLRCCDVWGSYADVNWDNIERVKSTRVYLGLTYLKVFSSHLKRPLWLPLFLRNGEQFFRVVSKYARPDSPLIHAMRAAGFGSSRAAIERPVDRSS